MAKSRTQILIIGGGLGGLVLGILLQRAGIDYLILEQSVLIRPIGSIIVLSSMVLPLMEQLGILEEIERLAIPLADITVHRSDLSVVGRLHCSDRVIDYKQRFGYYDQCISRPDLYNILLSRIPKDRLKLGKRFVNLQHVHNSETGADQVKVRCSDGTYYHADILVGADGSSSAVRQSLFRQLKEEGTLPKVDQEEQQYRQVSLLGVTNPLSPKKHPDLGKSSSHFKVVLGKNSPYMCWFMPIPGQRYSWLVTKTLEVPVTITSNNSECVDWGPDATDEMSKAVRHLQGPDGGTVGDLIDNSERQLISKVMLEERIFRTWYGGRTVLIGDACHKFVPFTGKGASECMLDAVVLASLLYDVPSFTNLDNIHEVFRTYYQLRAAGAKQAVDISSQFGSLLIRDGWSGELMRRMVFGLATTAWGRAALDKSHYNRIQASFLPPVADRGSAPARPHVAAKKGVVEEDQARAEYVSDHARVDEFFTGHNDLSLH
ncbi:hypothetical protein BGZ54_007583 [Gamsiella multidivaricata]|nr:hypothetical protein BGZ54_007583 [Gamsiella multidivaricata]